MPFPNCSSFIQFHDWLNCFAYVKNTLSDEVMPKVAPKNFSGPLLGYFLIRHAGNPHCFLYVQIFGSLPFTHVFVNRKLAVMAGFDNNIEVILEQISPTICTSLEVVPLSQHDYELLNEYGGEVEKLFLQQIRLVHPTMKFPLWVSPTMCIEFRIGSFLD
uniref:Peroxisome biogenesis factor 1 domain containing protein n=1 Tax=Haemonchus contortus TaxID=6289 RepID=W6NGM4_HAECO